MGGASCCLGVADLAIVYDMVDLFTVKISKEIEMNTHLWFEYII